MAEVKGRLAASIKTDAPPLSRRHLRSWHPGEKQRPAGCKGQRRFAPALFVVAAGSCSQPSWCRFTHLSPFAGAYRATTCRISCPGCNEQPTKLFAWGRKNFCVLPRTDASGRGICALAANGSQTGEGKGPGERSSRSPQNVKTAARQLNG